MSLPKSQIDFSCEWHVLLHGQGRGPYQLAALRQLLETHPEGWSALVWRPGMLEWRHAGQVDALVVEAFGSAREPAAPIPPAPPMPPAPPAPSAPPREAVTSLRIAASEARPFRSGGHLRGTIWLALSAVLAVALGAHLKSMSVRTPRALPAATVMRPVPAPPALPRIATRPSAATIKQPALPVVAAEAVLPVLQLDDAPPVRREAARKPARTRWRSDTVTHTGSRVKRVQIRAPSAPIRVGADQEASMLCSVPQGTTLQVFAELPGTKARWFAVRCDTGLVGWVHENFLLPVRR